MNNIRLGMLVYSTNSGLGIQTKELYDHLKPSKTMMIDLSALNGMQQHPDWYIGATRVNGYPNRGDVDEFLKDLDCLLVAETPLNYYLFERARELGVKTAQIPNYEFFDYYSYPERSNPDLIIAPTRWHYDKLEEFAQWRNCKLVYLHHPVNRDALPFREITEARKFLHVVGKPAAHDRNGTETVIAASKYLKSDAIIKVHFQGEQGLSHQATHNFEYYFRYLNEHGGNQIIMQQQDYEKYSDIYKEADVLLLPRRYGGNCLPMNEALSCGMPVIMSDVSPNDIILPKHWLVPATKTAEFKPRMVIDIFSCDPRDLAAKIDEFANMDGEAMATENQLANAIAEQISWETLLPMYEKTLEDLCRPS